MEKDGIQSLGLKAMFLKANAHQGWIYLIENTVKTVILWDIIAIWMNYFLC